MRLALNHLPFNIAMMPQGCSKLLIGHLIGLPGSGIRIFSSLVAN